MSPLASIQVLQRSGRETVTAFQAVSTMLEEESTRETMGKKSSSSSSSSHSSDATQAKVKTWSCCGINPYTGLTCDTNNDKRYHSRYCHVCGHDTKYCTSCYDRQETWTQYPDGQWVSRVKDYNRD
ncbi:uncharacterized protein PG986_001995 [Apiospora aurea]|uniref:Uncharacterized protein n=1 Tax=Apiospora aurea TaxID=335848 RepID=A0ABR1QYH2_9PEZI